MDIVKMTRELGKAIQQDERYIALVTTGAATEKNPELHADMIVFSQLRAELNAALSEPEKNKDKLSELDGQLQKVYNRIIAAPEMVAYHAAKREMEDLISFLTQIITGSANGEDPDLIEPQAACDGSCSSCSGCN